LVKVLIEAQLAKRKAEELEDFGGTYLRLAEDVNSFRADGSADDGLPKYSKSETDEGTALMRQFMETWKARAESLDDLNGESGASEEAQVDELRRVAEEFGERFKGSAWITGLMDRF